MGAQEQVKLYIEQNKQSLVKLLSDLVNIPSVNPYFDEEASLKGEGDAQRYLANFLQEMGLSTSLVCPDVNELEPYKDKAGYYADHTFEDRPNLLAVKQGAGGGKSILLSGHMDVVQVGNKWTKPPFQATLEGDVLYGRGTVDMKGGIAAMTFALKSILDCGITLKGDVKIGTVVDEEAGGMGTLALVAGGARADACLITEPTHLNVSPLCRGILWGKLIVEGRAGHIEEGVAHFSQGGAVDAIEKAQIYLQAFARLNQEWALTKNHKYLPVPCQVKVAQFNAGEYPTTYANRAELVFDAQYLPSDKDENGLGSKIKQELLQFVHDVAQTDPWLKQNPPTIQWLIDADCGETLESDPFFKLVHQYAKITKPDCIIRGGCGHTDMGWFTNVGIPTMTYGPGNGNVAHQADEHIEVSQLVQCAQTIAQIIMDWCEVESK